MSASRSVLCFLVSFFIFSLVQCAEFVPCFIWSNKRTNKHVPALNKVSQDVFKNDIKHYLEEGSLLVVFAEQTLSPEDFAQHHHETFPNLAKLKKSTKLSYLPNVQNPIKTLTNLDVTITESSLDRLGTQFEIPKTDILIVNLDDAEDSENRIDMLKRHDAAIASIFEELSNKNDNIVVMYTAYHSSWVASEDVMKSRQTRSLLQNNAEDNNIQTKSTATGNNEPIPPLGNSTTFFSTSKIYLYVSEASYILKGSSNIIKFDYYLDSSNASFYIFTATGNDKYNVKMEMTFTNTGSYGYWEQVNPITAVVSNSTYNESFTLTPTTAIYAPNKFSFHCGDQAFYTNDLTITLKDFQIQLFFNDNPNNSTNKFGDAYDCVGFTSVPIWSGLFVTAILLIIMTIGITMMMDIRTMDRFDDAKGKTITINAE